MSSYEDLRPYWEVWKRNTARPPDPSDADLWDTMREMFMAISQGTRMSSAPEAFAFLKKSLPRWRERLKEVAVWDPLKQRIKLFRGLRNKAAIDARITGNFELLAGKPTSFAFTRDSAVGFAGQGDCDGCLYSFDVPLETVVFADVDKLYNDGNLDLEAEVVVVLPEPMSGICENQSITQRARLPHNRAEKAELEARRASLAKYETEFREQISRVNKTQ